MPPSKKPANEAERLAALKRYQILDTESEALFDSIANIAATICDVPIALISLIDSERQWFKARVGLDARETHRDLAFCAYAIQEPDELLIVEDATKDERFKDNPLVNGEPDIRFYAGAPLVTWDKQALGTLCVIDDKPRVLTDKQIEALSHLSKQVCANLELRIRSKYLEELNASRNKMLSVLSHDIRSPLLSIISGLDLLSDSDLKFDTEDKRKFLAELKKGTNNTLHMAESLLKMSQLELGQFRYEPEQVQLGSLVNGAAFSLSGALQAKKIVLNIDFPSETEVWCDRDMAQSILQNLLSNAIKFTKNGGTIKLTAAQVGDATEIQIQDDGVGIKPEILETLLSDEKHHSSFGTNGEKGSGLGLSLCKRFANINKGDLVLKSEYGNGTTAILRLLAKAA